MRANVIRSAAAVVQTLLAAAVVLQLMVVGRASGARVLGVFPHSGYSHHMMFLPYLRGLADRGHDVHVISNFPSSHPAITDVDLRGAIPMNIDIAPIAELWPFGLVGTVRDIFMLRQMAFVTEGMFGVPAVRRLLDDPGAAFDLVVGEHFNSEVSLGFAARYRAPFVLLSSHPLMPWTLSAVGQTQGAAYRPSLFAGHSGRMGPGQRLDNALSAFAANVLFRAVLRPWSRGVLREHLGADVPLDEMVSNVSLVLVNTHWTVHGATPAVPAVVEVGGIHVGPVKRLPTDIQQFIEEAEHGVIYFCMGSLLRGETFPAEKRQMFLNVFSKIPQRILWKWEGDELPGKPPNVMIRKWMPQRDILAHPNVKLFISHGGLLGTTEAVHEGVPILSMPMFGDQMTNVKAVQDKGAAEILDFGVLNEDDIFVKVKTMLTNPIYKQKAKELSEAFHDRPMSPLDTAVYWTEYVIRHKGAPHLRSVAAGMPWYQYYLIDVMFVIFLAISSVCIILYYLVFKILIRFIKKQTKEKQT